MKKLIVFILMFIVVTPAYAGHRDGRRLSDRGALFYFNRILDAWESNKPIVYSKAMLPDGYRLLLGFDDDLSDANADYTKTLTEAGWRILAPNIDVSADYYLEASCGIYGNARFNTGSGVFTFGNVSPINSNINFNFSTGEGIVYGFRGNQSTDECFLLLSDVGGRTLVITDYDYRSIDHQTTPSTNPTLYIQSGADPSSGDNYLKRLKMYHDQTNGIFESEEGAVYLKPENFTVLMKLTAKSADPSEPASGEMVIWVSDGTGKGDDGDVMIGYNNDGTTKYGTLLDYSSASTW